MKDKILLPSAWDNLTADDQELAKELMQSILRGEASLQLLSQLLNDEIVDNEFTTTAKSISNHEFDFEVTTPENEQPSSPGLILTSLTTPIISQASTILVSALKRQCDNICRQPGQVRKCKKCREMFP